MNKVLLLILVALTATGAQAKHYGGYAGGIHYKFCQKYYPDDMDYCLNNMM